MERYLLSTILRPLAFFTIDTVLIMLILQQLRGIG